MDDCNYKIFNNKRLMPKQEKRKEKRKRRRNIRPLSIRNFMDGKKGMGKYRTIPQASQTKQEIYIRTTMER